jgi:putative transcriptional regulator
MNTKNSSPAAIATELGERLKKTRLNANISQHKLALMIGMSVKSVKNAEKGKCQFETMVAILMALGKADQLDLLLPASTISPIQLAKLQGKQRQRATNKNSSGTQASMVKPAW